MNSKYNKDKIQEHLNNENYRQSTESDLHHNEETNTVPVVEEQLNVDVRTVETGEVRITKQVHEEDVTVDVPLLQEDIEVRRVSKNLPVETPPEVRYEGDTMIIPVLKEELVVQKKLVLVEEIHVTRHSTEKHQPQQVNLRKEEIKINRSENT